MVAAPQEGVEVRQQRLEAGGQHCAPGSLGQRGHVSDADEPAPSRQRVLEVLRLHALERVEVAALGGALDLAGTAANLGPLGHGRFARASRAA
jgi:hypothetical protein